MFRYRLIVITSGRRDCFANTVASFIKKVRPKPAEALVFDDGGQTGPDVVPHGWQYRRSQRKVGFCGATAAGWKLAAEPGVDYIYWLEDDFLHNRAVDLTELAFVLEQEPQLAQMALMRQPVNAEEVAAGSFVRMRPGSYHRKGSGGMKWLEHGVNWTTNPALFSRGIAAEYGWPVIPECEGHFGIKLREERPGTTFGLWGDGDPWVHHSCERAGWGY